MILAVLNAYLLTRLVVTATRALVSPDRPALRPLPLGDAAAAFILAWVRRIAIIAVFGYAFAEVGLLFGLYRVAHDALLKLVALAVGICLVVVVLLARQPVAERIRGHANGRGGAVAVLRNRLAGAWHIVAVFYILALWLVWALELPDGFARLLHVFVAAIVVLGVARLVNVWTIRGLERALRIDPHRRRPPSGAGAARPAVSPDRAHVAQRCHRRGRAGGAVSGLGAEQLLLVRHRRTGRTAGFGPDRHRA